MFPTHYLLTSGQVISYLSAKTKRSKIKNETKSIAVKTFFTVIKNLEGIAVELALSPPIPPTDPLRNHRLYLGEVEIANTCFVQKILVCSFSYDLLFPTRLSLFLFLL